MVDNPRAVISCIRRLRFPKSASVNIELYRQPSAVRLVRFTSYVLHKLDEARSLTPICTSDETLFRAVTITHSEIDARAQGPYRLVLDLKTSSTRGHMCLTLQHGHEDPLSASDVLWALNSAFDVPGIREVRLVGTEALPEEVWRNVFEPMQGLRLVRFEGSPVLQFLKWLTRDPSLPRHAPSKSNITSGSAGNHPTTLAPWLPNLSRLEFNSVVLEPEEEIRAALILLDVVEKRLAVKDLVPVIEVSLRRYAWFEEGQYAAERAEMPKVCVRWEDGALEDWEDMEDIEGNWSRAGRLGKGRVKPGGNSK
ncbi:hypothetical protein D9611_005611 [Ephemerocybe angulata]|uniref:Uncharacterized protein n=1 Tax=Ephemerocybe angulata TaxID=980116 RepID=A0A8H5F4I6_9AGAR|nr:hypothetical protein D9611_005611 [Tulosesus angulatus]